MEGSDFADRNANPPETISEQARSLGQEAKTAASDATEKVRSTFEEQAAKIGDKAKEVAADAGEKVQDALSRQRAAGADYMENVATLVHQAADVFGKEIPPAAHYIHQAAQRIGTVAEAVRTKNAREVAHEVQDFARRQPAIFFGGALLLGFAAVRLFKASPVETGQAPRSAEH